MQEYLFFAIAIFLLLYFYLTRHFDHWKNKNVPFIKPVPFFGNAIVSQCLTMRLSMGEMFYELHKKSTKPVVGFFILDKPCLLLRNTELVKRILVTDFQHFFDRGVLNNKRDDPIGSHNLFFLKNPAWKNIRSKISPVFSSAKMKTMSFLTTESADKMIDYIDKKIEEKSGVEMKEVCMKFTVDVITSTIFGVYSNVFDGENSQFWTVAKRIINWNDFIISFRIRCYFLAHTIAKLFRMRVFDPNSVRFLEKNFWDIINQRTRTNYHRNDLIDILLKMKNDDRCFIEGDILVAQVVVFFTARFETSSSAMGFALYEMAQNQEIQAKLRNEIHAVAEKYSEINYDAIREMKYLDMCVKEVLRKYPVLAFLERSCNSDYIIPETGTRIDKGTSVFVSILGLHLDPDYFPNPDIFDPQRFSLDYKQKIDSYCYLPFGEGPRNCIGARFGLMTMKYGLANILKNFTVEICEDTPTKINYNPNGMLLATVSGITLRVKRNNN